MVQQQRRFRGVAGTVHDSASSCRARLATAVWLCAEAGARAVVVVNDLRDDGPGRPAFRMGLFGSLAPPIAAFMNQRPRR